MVKNRGGHDASEVLRNSLRAFIAINFDLMVKFWLNGQKSRGHDASEALRNSLRVFIAINFDLMVKNIWLNGQKSHGHDASEALRNSLRAFIAINFDLLVKPLTWWSNFDLMVKNRAGMMPQKNWGIASARIAEIFDLMVKNIWLNGQKSRGHDASEELRNSLSIHRH